MKKLIKRIIRKFIYMSDGKLFCRRMNRYGHLIGFLPQLTWADGDDVYEVCDQKTSLFVARKSRLHLQKNGVSNRLDFLLKEYLVDPIDFYDGDIIIDVGANVGELSKALSMRRSLRIVAIEPEQLEFDALKKNLEGSESEAFNSLLWSCRAELEFYSANETGDSSIFKPRTNVGTSLRTAISLDELATSSKILSGEGPIKLLKLEAEGAEPEILEGASRLLKRIEYVAADVGPERGVTKESTLIPVQRILMNSGFVPVEFALPRAVMLFKKMRD